MLQLEEPRHITEQEDVHLIETFLISDKLNEAGWALNRNTKTDIQEWVGKDFVMIPEKIFDPTESQPGHVSGDSYEEEMAEIRKHSHGKIVKVKGPYNYDDGSDNRYFKAVVRLKDSLSANSLVENGNKTWVPFAVSPQIWREEGPRENVTKYKPMGLFLVIKGAYGENSVVEKMCTGSALKCGTSLSAAIHQLNHDTNDQHLSEVLTSYISVIDKNKVSMSAQTPEQVQTPVQNFTKPELVQHTLNQPVELKKDETISLTKDEYDKLNKSNTEQADLKTEVEQLKKERNESIINQVFGSIEDQEARNKIFAKYAELKDARVVKQVYEDFNTYILPKAIAKATESKTEVKSEKASVLKPEPKSDKKESLSASVETDDISISECRSILRL